METFVLTEDHLKLLSKTYVGWNGCEFGAPAIDCKRPYGNSNVVADICEILEWEYEREDEQNAYEQGKKAGEIHRGTMIALQIVLLNISKPISLGTYVRSRKHDNRSWEYVGG